MRDYRELKEQKDKGFIAVAFSVIGALLFAGAIYGGGLWGVLLVLRRAEVIDSIMSYRNCVLVSYVYVLLRSYDNQLFSKK